MAEMARTFAHRLSARLTLEVPVDGTHPGIHQTTHFLLLAGFIHDFWKLNFGYGIRFLDDGGQALGISRLLGAEREGRKGAYDFLWRQNSKLDLFDLAQRRARVRKCRHDF